MTTIDEATTTQLIHALQKRCPSIVIGMHVPDDQHRCETRTFISGNRAACLGLAHIVVFRCENALGFRQDDHAEDVEDEDDPGED